MVNQKIDLYKLNEEEWIRYKRMDKIATHERKLKQGIAVAIITISLIVILAYVAISATPNIHKAALFVNSASIQLNSSLKVAGIANLTLYNNTALIINHLTSNPHALASFVMWMFAVGMFLGAVAPLLATAFLIFILYLFIMNMNNNISEAEIYSFKYLKRRLASLEHIRNILRAHSFTEQEIDWYYEVKNETRKLLIKIGE
jgi:hypothetical protein